MNTTEKGKEISKETAQMRRVDEMELSNLINAMVQRGNVNLRKFLVILRAMAQVEHIDARDLLIVAKVAPRVLETIAQELQSELDSNR